MKIIKNFFFYYLIYLLFWKSNSLKCGENEIENCLKCGIGDKINTCEICNNKYFLFYNNLMCLSCSDPLYGQIGCVGNCKLSSTNNTNIICDKDGCKEGFYNLNGICIKCYETGYYPCKTCTISLDKDNYKKYNCTKCLSNSYILTSYGECLGCYISYCNKCHYDDLSEKICDECREGFYPDNSRQRCKECHDSIEISNGHCKICSDNLNDYESGQCWCDTFYTLKDHSTCVKCPENCHNCKYNNKTNKIECISCEQGYTITPQKTCSYCGDGCQFCSLSENLSPNCLLCFSQKFLNNNKCLICPENCISCDINQKCLQCKMNCTLLSDGTCIKCPDNCMSCTKSGNNDIACTRCFEKYALNSKKECVYCSNITEDGMEGCEKCGYNLNTNKYECYECSKKKRSYGILSYELFQAYTFIINTFRCFDNTDKNRPEFYGCLEAYKNEDQYECIKCENTENRIIHTMVNDSKKCIDSSEYGLGYCYEAENKGTETEPLYSCTKCEDSYALILKGNKNVCEPRNDYFNKYLLSLCLEGKVDDNKNYECTKCVPNSHLTIDKRCICDHGSFSKDYIFCNKCDDISPGCINEQGCQNPLDNQFSCVECKTGYFREPKGSCYYCLYEINNCEICHYNELTSTIICDKCVDGYNYNINENKCDFENCEDYPEISEGCIICDGKREEYISNKKCHKCKPIYFKTKDEQCVNCRSDNYGGSGCLKCKYALDNNNEQTNQIICDICPEDDYISSDGKCFNCQKNIVNCEICKFIKNNDYNEKLVCSICKPGYYLNSEGKCITYVNYLKLKTNCQSYFYQINQISFCFNQRGDYSLY